jgi:hypothetical protein
MIRRHPPRRRARCLLVTVVLLAASACATPTTPNPDGVPCDDRQGSARGPSFHLWKSGSGECIGWTVEEDYGFGSTPAISDVIHKIVEKNTAIKQQKYVRVAVLTPMTGPGVMLNSGIEDALRGVLVAQSRAADPDQDKFLGSHDLGVQIVLANMGRNGDQWEGPEGQSLITDLTMMMADPQHPLVAVTGLGASFDTTEAAAEALSKAGLPAVGAALTGTLVTGIPQPPAGDPALAKSTLVHVAPSNDDLVYALRRWVELHNPAVGYLVRDVHDEHDLHIKSLTAAVRSNFADRFKLSTQYAQFDGSYEPGSATSNNFLTSANNIRCGNVDVVFYSGRSRDLRDFLAALTGVHGVNCDHPVTVATTTTGIDTIANDTQLRSDMRTKHVAVVEAMVTDYRSWLAGLDAPPSFQDFYAYYHGDKIQGTDDMLADGYTILHHDAVITVVYAIRLQVGRTNDKQQAAPVTAANLVNELVSINAGQPVPAAGGDIYFGDTTQTHGWPHNKPIPLTVWPDGSPNSALPRTYRTP